MSLKLSGSMNAIAVSRPRARLHQLSHLNARAASPGWAARSASRAAWCERVLRPLARRDVGVGHDGASSSGDGLTWMEPAHVVATATRSRAVGCASPLSTDSIPWRSDAVDIRLLRRGRRRGLRSGQPPDPRWLRLAAASPRRLATARSQRDAASASSMTVSDGSGVGWSAPSRLSPLALCSSWRRVTSRCTDASAWNSRSRHASGTTSKPTQNSRTVLALRAPRSWRGASARSPPLRRAAPPDRCPRPGGCGLRPSEQSTDQPVLVRGASFA